jgi:hypothetical protein
MQRKCVKSYGITQENAQLHVIRDVQSIMHESDTLEGVLRKMAGLQIATCRTWWQHADSSKKSQRTRHRHGGNYK